MKHPDVELYNTIGELKYGLAYSDGAQQPVDPNQVQAWMREAHQAARSAWSREG
jgi:4-amino-4-deoxy-L-arabinose transferase